MKEALEAINKLKEEGLITEYAIGGGMATVFHAEPFMTYDWDVFVILPETGTRVIDLGPIYDRFRNLGYETEKEYIIIADMPLQFLVPGDELEAAAVRDAIEVEYEGVPTRVMRAEHLIAVFLKAHRPKDIAKISALVEQANLDMELLSKILKTSGLWEKWQKFRKEHS